jgi:hypothetical protein
MRTLLYCACTLILTAVQIVLMGLEDTLVAPLGRCV